MCFIQVVALKLFWQFCKSKQIQFHILDLYKTGKSIKNWSSKLDLIEKTMNLSPNLLAVKTQQLKFNFLLKYFVYIKISFMNIPEMNLKNGNDDTYIVEI